MAKPDNEEPREATKVFQCKQKFGPFHQFRTMYTDRGLKVVYDGCSVDIIVPYHGRYDLVRKLVKSILEFTRSNPYQITLVDDGSLNDKGAATEFIHTLQQAPQTVCRRLEKHSGFGAAVNHGLQNTTQPYVCIMHSDCQVESLNWLESMGASLVTLKKQNVRMVVPRSNNPGEDEISELLAERTSERVEDMIAQTPLPFYCTMCHRDLFKRIGPIKSYPYTWFENEEFFYRMKNFGYKQAICGASWIKHDGKATIKQVWKNIPTAEEEMYQNRERCLADIRSLRCFS